MGLDFKVRIIQPGIAHYRVELYEGLLRVFGRRMELWAGPRVAAGNSSIVRNMRYDYSHDFVHFGPVFWQKGVNCKGLSKGDVLVVCGDVHHISTLLIAAIARFKGIGVVWWAHHRSATSRKVLILLRVFLVRCLADIILVYTRSGIDWYKERGIKGDQIFATSNTLSVKEVDEAVEKTNNNSIAEQIRKFNLAGKKLILFCSSLRPKTNLELLIDALPRICSQVCNAHLVVIGDGPRAQAIRTQIAASGMENHVLMLGKMIKQEELAPWFMSADVFVYPGAVGLSMLHAFAYGLPVVVHNNPMHQMPEYEAFKDGINGLSFNEGDVDDLAQKTISLLRDDHMRAMMSKSARDTIRREYSMEKMISSFSNAIHAAHKRALNRNKTFSKSQ